MPMEPDHAACSSGNTDAGYLTAHERVKSRFAISSKVESSGSSVDPSAQIPSLEKRTAIGLATVYVRLHITIRNANKHRIYRQLRYGCDNPGCKRPACRTYQSNRKSERPYRRPTKLAARHIAACIASSDYPLKHVCDGQVNSLDEPWDVAFPQVDLVAPDASAGPEDGTILTGSEIAKVLDEVRLLYGGAPPGPEQVDEKSFSQMLFTTTAWQKAQSRDVAEHSRMIRLLSECYEHRDSVFVCPDADLKAATAVICEALRQICEPFIFGQEQDRESSLDLNWEYWLKIRQYGEFMSSVRKFSDGFSDDFSADPRRQRDWTSVLLDDHNLRVAKLVLANFASRTLDKSSSAAALLEQPILHLLDEFDVVQLLRELDLDVRKPVSFPSAVLEWCRYVLQLAWNNSPIVKWSSMAGAAIRFMQMLCMLLYCGTLDQSTDYTDSHREALGIQAEAFATHFLYKRTDFIEVAKSWLANKVEPHSFHLLSLPWLFEQSSLVSYFRAMNHATMSTAVNTSLSLRAIISRHMMLARNHEGQIYEKLMGAVSQFLVLEVNRSTILEDAMSELWRRDKRQLRRPLKVRMGMEEGEEGVDLGGVQQEFLRLAFGEVMNPDYGAFTVDERTRMAWFMPCSRMPMYQYQLIGMLMGLAVYNGITLSVTFPEALYRKLLGHPVDSVAHISDGWPELGRSLQMLLDYSGDDVEDVFALSHIFATDAIDGRLEVSMQKHRFRRQWPADRAHPSDPPDVLEAAPAVRNSDRANYVAEYLKWLVERSVAAEFDAFARGFFALVEPRTIAIFSPVQLRALVEGLRHDVDVAALERTATYEGGYARHDAVVKRFWTVVRRLSPADLLKLLAFVTASDRIPARGIGAITFTVQRNGDSDERLPTSMTCFGRLLLPAYSTLDIMEKRLRQAIEHGLGFGVA